MAKRLLVGEFQVEVLRAVDSLSNQAYGTRVRDFIQRRIDRQVNMPQVYTALIRLEKLGLVSSTVEEKACRSKGRPRRFYSVSDSGYNMLWSIGRLSMRELPDERNGIVSAPPQAAFHTP